jgi:regulator of sigma E protease
MDVLVMAAQMILGLSILVGLHELGHLLAAKMFGMRVEQYSIGFPPRIFKFKYGETVYSIGAVPLGGYVKISGMIDESLDVKSMSEEPKPWEFRAKPAWQRLIVMMGGILVNVITGIIIFIVIAYSMGDTYIPKEEVNRYGIYAYDIAREIGLETGDKIMEVNGHDYKGFDDLTSADVLLESDAYYTVSRNGESLKVEIPANILEQLSPSRTNKDPKFIDPIFRFRIGEVIKGTGAAQGGMQEGDRIVSINGIPVDYYFQYKLMVDSLEEQTVQVVVERNENTMQLEIPVSSDGTMGFYPVPQISYASEEYSLGEAIPLGINQAFNIVFVNIKAFGKIFSGDLDFSKSVSGPIGIAKIFGGDWDWLRFWRLVGLLSMILAFMNFLPIPALDGGHVMFLTFEIVSGQKPSDKFMETAQKVGMVLLLSLMVFIIFNDIIKEVF